MSISANKQDSTQQAADHAAHHNALADAANDHTDRLVDLETAVPNTGSKGTFLSRKAKTITVGGTSVDVNDWVTIRQVTSPTSGNVGKYLRATGVGTYAWEALDLPSKIDDLVGVPSYTGKKNMWLYVDYQGNMKWKTTKPPVSGGVGVPDPDGDSSIGLSAASTGDVLTFTSQGMAWDAPVKELPSRSSTPTGYVLAVKSGGGLEWVPQTQIPDIPDALPAYNANDVGKVLTVSTTTVAGTTYLIEEWKDRGVPLTTNASAGNLLTVNSDGTYTWQDKLPAAFKSMYAIDLNKDRMLEMYESAAPGGGYEYYPRWGRRIFTSSAAPNDATDGVNGDIWLRY